MVYNCSILYVEITNFIYLTYLTFQNKYMIFFGSVAFASCVGYIMYMRHTALKEKKYVVLNQQDQLVMKEKKSRWE